MLVTVQSLILTKTYAKTRQCKIESIFMIGDLKLLLIGFACKKLFCVPHLVLMAIHLCGEKNIECCKPSKRHRHYHCPSLCARFIITFTTFCWKLILIHSNMLLFLCLVLLF